VKNLETTIRVKDETRAGFVTFVLFFFYLKKNVNSV